MTVSTLLNVVRANALAASETQHSHPRIGIVSSYDPSHYAVKAKIQPDGTETGWMPVLAVWGGNGWGDFAPPSPGDTLLVVFQEGGRAAGIALGRFFSTLTQPLAVPSGERWIVHASGACVKLTNDGKLTLADKAGSTMVMTADGSVTISANVQVTGNLVVSGNISDVNGAHGTLASLRATYDTHTHPAPNGTTGTPNQTL